MAAAAILKITLLAISRPLLHIFAPNLIQRLKTALAARFTVKIHIKIQDGGSHHFEIS